MTRKQLLAIREKRLGAIGAYLGAISPLIESFENSDATQRIRTFAQTAPDDIISALRLLNGVVGAGIVIHGARGCAAAQLSMAPDGAWATTNLNERDTIMGSDVVLRKTIVDLHGRHKPRVIFVVATPGVAINNDDIQSVTTELSDELNIPVIPVRTDGFRSRIAATGYDAAIQAIQKSAPHGDTERIQGLINPGDCRQAPVALQREQDKEPAASPLSMVFYGKQVYLGLQISEAIVVASLVHASGGIIAGISVEHVDAGHLNELKALQELQPGIVLHVAGGQPFEEANLLRRIRPDLYLGTPERAVWAARAGIPTVAVKAGDLIGYAGPGRLLRQVQKALANPSFVQRLERADTLPYKDAWYRRSPDWHIKLEVK